MYTRRSTTMSRFSKACVMLLSEGFGNEGKIGDFYRHDSDMLFIWNRSIRYHAGCSRNFHRIINSMYLTENVHCSTFFAFGSMKLHSKSWNSIGIIL